MLKYIRTILILIILWPVTSPAAPQVSPELYAVLERQKTRVLAGNRDVTFLRNELQPLAEKGDPVAQFLYATISIGNSDKEHQAIHYLQASASSGCVGAAGIIAIHFLAKQPSMGRYWLRYAAENGDASLQYFLSINHLSGQNGFEKDPALSYAWLLLAADQVYNRGLQGQVEMSLAGFEIEYSKDVVASGRKLYTKMKSDYGITPYHICGQGLAGNNRLSDQEVEAIRQFRNKP